MYFITVYYIALSNKILSTLCRICCQFGFVPNLRDLLFFLAYSVYLSSIFKFKQTLTELLCLVILFKFFSIFLKMFPVLKKKKNEYKFHMYHKRFQMNKEAGEMLMPL